MSVKVIVKVAPVFELPEIRLGADIQQALELTVHLLKPASLAAFVLAFWRFAADLNWTSDFLISDGVLSHWQIWTALGISMLAAQSYLVRRMTRA